MLATMQHRGPNESGIYIDSSIGLAHARLSIIGLDSGTQPIGNEDGRLWIVYNGEAFNYPELKAGLVEKGHVFTTDTDTEVVLHLYEELGPACLDEINGQFAFAIWDSIKKELFLARDRVGIRPLYYCRFNGRFNFASEVKTLFADHRVQREINPKALHQVFTCWSPLSPSTPFQGVYELPPAHFMTVTADRTEFHRYWHIPGATSNKNDSWTFEDAIEELSALIADAIRLRLRADVPVGAYLSGGLDSSYITALIAQRFQNRLCTFSLGFQEEAFDETVHQEEMIRFLGTTHRRIGIDNTDIRAELPEVIWHCEKPLLRTAPVPLFNLSRLARDSGFRVVLTGEGADEVFAGYHIFKESKVRRFWGKRPDSKCRPMLIEKLYPYVFKQAARSRQFLYKFYSVSPEELDDPLFSHTIRWKNTGKNVSFFSDDVLSDVADYHPVQEVADHLPPDFTARDPLSKAQFLEMTIFLSNYLLSSQGDRVAMAHSLETRMPYLDHRLIDFAFRLPSKWKLNGMDEKHILKKAAASVLPGRICRRPKQPYRAPIVEPFLDHEQDDYVEALLSERGLRQAGLFNEKKVSGLIRRIRNTDSKRIGEPQQMAFIGILTTQLLQHRFVQNDPSAVKPKVEPAKVIRKG
jgi:asparagine synthase (glutamine-hydrolysing)